MNNLSWLLYLGDVADHFGIICVILDLFIFCYVILGSGLMSIMEENIRLVPHVGKLITVFFVIIFIAGAVPSKQTVYLIAASQTSQQIINSKTGQKAEKLLYEYINKEIQNLKQNN